MHPPSPPIPQQHPGPRQDSWVLSREEEEEVMAFGARSHPAVGLVPSALAREEGELRALFYYFFWQPKDFQCSAGMRKAFALKSQYLPTLPQVQPKSFSCAISRISMSVVEQRFLRTRGAALKPEPPIPAPASLRANHRQFLRGKEQQPALFHYLSLPSGALRLHLRLGGRREEGKQSCCIKKVMLFQKAPFVYQLY